MAAYYNEIDKFAAAWLRELITNDLIAPGDVDERSIVDVKPDDLRGYRQAHFFAGIGVWSYALRRAGWADDRAVWTGSCPCQPFSSAGKGDGADDSRHLWPTWFHLIEECRPVVVFGEQVASADGLGWIDLVHADLEGADYAVGAVDCCAAGLGAPHIRQRLFFVADTDGSEWRSNAEERRDVIHRPDAGWKEAPGRSELGRSISQLADTCSERRQQERGSTSRDENSNGRQPHGDHVTTGDGEAGELGDAGGSGLQGRERQKLSGAQPEQEGRTAKQSGRSFWSACDWLPCRDGKARPVEPGSFPLATGTPARVGRLRGYGNAINAEVAKAFIEAYLDTVGDHA